MAVEALQLRLLAAKRLTAALFFTRALELRALVRIELREMCCGRGRA